MSTPNPSSTPFPPYWTRLGSFFVYPLRVEPLLVCIGLAVIYALASFGGLIFRLILPLVILYATLRYGFTVLEKTARGHIDDEDAIFESLHGNQGQLPLKQGFAVLIGLLLCGGAGYLGGKTVAMIITPLVFFLWPANTMVLAITNDLGASLSPGRLAFVVRTMGLPYLGLWACLFLISASCGYVLSLLLPRLPLALIGLCFGFVTTYFTVMMFRMMGYALYQYHETLGFDVQIQLDRQAAPANQATPAAQASKDRIGQLLREGRHQEAIEEARGAVLAAPGDMDPKLHLHRLLLALPQEAPALAELARELIPQLLARGNGAKALEVLEQVWTRDGGFQPSVPDQVVSLARQAWEGRRPDALGKLVQGFDRRFPGHPAIPDIYLLGARLLVEFRRDEAQAARVLAAIRQHFPDTPAAREAAELEELVARLRALQPGASG